MIFLKKIIRFCIIIFCLTPDNPVIASEKLHPWGQIALMDLKVIQQTIKQHHVGPVDTENPNYKIWLNDGYNESIKMTFAAASFNDYMAIISHYTDGFDDGHITFTTI